MFDHFFEVQTHKGIDPSPKAHAVIATGNDVIFPPAFYHHGMVDKIRFGDCQLIGYSLKGEIFRGDEGIIAQRKVGYGF